MEALIKKAIEAIKSDKKEYAMGLLEGALEMTVKEIEEKPRPGSSTTVAQTAPVKAVEVADEIGELDLNRLNQIKSMANIEILK